MLQPWEPQGYPLAARSLAACCLRPYVCTRRRRRFNLSRVFLRPIAMQTWRRKFQLDVTESMSPCRPLPLQQLSASMSPQHYCFACRIIPEQDPVTHVSNRHKTQDRTRSLPDCQIRSGIGSQPAERLQPPRWAGRPVLARRRASPCSTGSRRSSPGWQRRCPARMRPSQKLRCTPQRIPGHCMWWSSCPCLAECIGFLLDKGRRKCDRRRVRRRPWNPRTGRPGR